MQPHRIPLKIAFLRWSSMSAAALSALWIVLLAALVVRSQMSGRPFPVLAKFSPFHNHLLLVDRWLTLFPGFALIAALLLAVAWYIERNFRHLRTMALADAFLIMSSPIVILLNPGGYFSWFMS